MMPAPFKATSRKHIPIELHRRHFRVMLDKVIILHAIRLLICQRFTLLLLRFFSCHRNPLHTPLKPLIGGLYYQYIFFTFSETRPHRGKTPYRGLILSIHFFYIFSIARFAGSCYTFCATHPDTQVAEGVIQCRYAPLCKLSWQA